MKSFSQYKKNRVAPKTYLKYKHAKALLEEYQKINREKLNFDKLKLIFFEKFYLFLLAKKNMLNNTANKNIKFIKTFIIWANKNGYSDNAKYKDFKSEWNEGDVIYLTESELEQLRDYKIEGENKDRLKRVRDLFLFQCYTGVRYSDIEKISHEDIKGSMWEFRTKKTEQDLTIPLTSDALSILAKYSDNPQPLPVISNQKMNAYLKELCKLAKLNEPVKIIQKRGNETIETIHPKYEVIGTHTARRTFITLSLQRGMSAQDIKDITGHKTYAMMEKYKGKSTSHLRDVMDKTWGSSLRVAK